MADEFYERGFSLAPSPTDMARSDFFEHDKVVSVHYNECEELLKQRMGAKHVLAFDYIVRSIDGKRANIKISGGSGVQGVASGVHADYTLNGAPRRLVQLSEEPRANDVRLRSLTTEELARATHPEGRWCIVNVWRNIRSEPLEKTPLALLDCTSVEESDFCCVEQRMVDRTERIISLISTRSTSGRLQTFPSIGFFVNLLFSVFSFSKVLLPSSRTQRGGAY
jgi:hypothetical protein